MTDTKHLLDELARENVALNERVHDLELVLEYIANYSLDENENITVSGQAKERLFSLIHIKKLANQSLKKEQN